MLTFSLSVNAKPFMDSMQRIVAAFNGLAAAMKPTIDRVAEFSKRWAPPAAPGPFRVKRGKGQRRNRRNRPNCDCKTRGAWGAKSGENHYTDCPRFPGGRW